MSQPNTPTPAPSGLAARLPLLVGLFFALLFLLPLCSYQVRSTQVAIIRTFGRFDPTPINAGLHFKWPWPVQKVSKFDTFLHILRNKFEETYTADGNTVVVALFTAWRIERPAAFLESVGTLEEAERLLTGLLSTERGAVIARHPLRHLVSTQADELRFTEIEGEMLSRVQAVALDKYGIHVETIGIEQLALDEKIVPNVFARMQEERTFTANQIRFKGQEEADRLRAAANEKRDIMLAAAEADARRTRGEGDLAAAKAFEEFKKDVEFALFLRKLEALTELTKSRTTLILDREVLPFDLLKSRDTEPEN